MNYCYPLTGEPLEIGRNQSLYDIRGELAFENYEGSYDFVVDAPSQKERTHYDSKYAEGGWTSKESLDVIDYHDLWEDEPGSREYFKSLGDLMGKKVLLIGNGTSVKEFLFVRLGAQVTFTDLSFQGVLYAKRRYQASQLGIERPNNCEFHAVNAYYLPFGDNTFDVICADAVIHHLGDLEALFAGIHRCLRPGGVCRFADTGYSSFWQGTKKGFLRPLQKYIHKKYGISPEDQKATERGGYTRGELEHLKTAIGFKSVYYKRVAFFDYMLWRMRYRLDARWVFVFRPAIRWLDSMLAKTPLMEAQGIALVFGFDK